jgi:hypothetical protein
MGNLFSVLGRYRAPGGVESDLAIGASKDASVFVAEAALRFEELSRRGQGFATMVTSAVAALVVRPTTVAALELFNGYQGGGPSLVVDRLFSQNLVSTAVNSGAGLWAMVTTPKAAPTTAALAIIGNSGKGYGGPVIPATGTTVVANGWFPFGPQYQDPNAAAPGGSWEALIKGRLIVPPQCSLCIHVVGSIVGDTYCSGASWFEKQIDLTLT